MNDQLTYSSKNCSWLFYLFETHDARETEARFDYRTTADEIKVAASYTSLSRRASIFVLSQPAVSLLLSLGAGKKHAFTFYELLLHSIVF